ncbi:lysozyme inhibitor LprI family protein [Rhizobium leguminosarum]|uniref:lysozyme inhibitor LprI family protein n=1 Tax=Rhizobium leguminosarum TaxID=384 RepID=UPI001FEEE8EC|nr:lysozyme inhibitor LprI family protein [Rhizobium leguminosarum]
MSTYMRLRAMFTVGILKREDDKLNATWKVVFEQATGQTKTDLLVEQRLWNTYKEASCQLYANGEWGAERAVLDYVSCRAGVIGKRITDLESYADLFKGN